MILFPIGFQGPGPGDGAASGLHVNDGAALNWAVEGSISKAVSEAITDGAALNWAVEGVVGDTYSEAITDGAALNWAVEGSVV